MKRYHVVLRDDDLKTFNICGPVINDADITF